MSEQASKQDVVLVTPESGPITVTVALDLTVDPYQWGCDTGSELEYVEDVRADVREYVRDLVESYLREQHPHATVNP